MAPEQIQQPEDADIRAFIEARATEEGVEPLELLYRMLTHEAHAAGQAFHLRGASDLYQGSFPLHGARIGAGALGHLMASEWPTARWTVHSTPHFFGGGQPVDAHQFDVDMLQVTYPELHFITQFRSRIDQAAFLLSAAFVEAAVTDFKPEAVRRTVRRSHRPDRWYFAVLDDCLARTREVRNALVHRWRPTPRAERLALDAFVVLSGLTHTQHSLMRLCQSDRPKAFQELATQLDIISQQVEASAKLMADVEAAEDAPPTNEKRFADLRGSLLEKAGGGMTLTEASVQLEVTRQALHKRIRLRTALGMMNGSELVLPKAQFVKDRGRYVVMPHLGKVLKLFNTAGMWSALQFLVDPDPNLAGEQPLQALAAGRVEEVVHAARAYLGDDED